MAASQSDDDFDLAAAKAELQHLRLHSVCQPTDKPHNIQQHGRVGPALGQRLPLLSMFFTPCSILSLQVYLCCIHTSYMLRKHHGLITGAAHAPPRKALLQCIPLHTPPWLAHVRDLPEPHLIMNASSCRSGGSLLIQQP